MSRLFIVSVLTLAILLFGCSKEVVEEEPVQEPSTTVQPQPEEPQEPEQPEEPQPPRVLPPEPAEVTEQVTEPVEEMAEDTSAVEQVEVKVLEQKEGQLEEVLEVVSAEDSIDVFYMVQPGDFLSLIAKNEYGKIAMWKMIYKWNRKKIGPNPDLIYPFHEFLLKKPKEIAEPLEYDYYEYTVKQNESLWSIAGTQYNNNYAWIVILRDNADVLGSDLQNIPPGTVLKLRSKLF